MSELSTADLSTASIVLALAMSLFTAVAAVWDVRYKRIPNQLTIPVFAIGWVYQMSFHGLPGVWDGFCGFLLGFGILFAIWIVGSGGGGDVKLMGALSVWLGFRMTLLVMVVSTGIILLMTLGILGWSLVSGTRRASNRQQSPGGLPMNNDAASPTPTAARQIDRRVMAYALPIAMATWTVMIWKLPTL